MDTLSTQNSFKHDLTFVKIKVTGDCFSYFYFYVIFSTKIKIKGISNNLDLDKNYPGHSEQHLRGFSRRSDTLHPANIGGTITFKAL